MHRWLAASIVLMAALHGGPEPRRAEGPNQSAQAAAITTLLDAYGDGTAGTIELGPKKDFRTALTKAGTAWLQAGPETDPTRRRRVLALVALDAAIEWPPFEGAEVSALLELGCEWLRGGPTDEFVRVWMLSSIAFAESERLSKFLIGEDCGRPSRECDHVRHALARFPDNPRFKAALTFARVELNVLTRRPVGDAEALVRMGSLGTSPPHLLPATGVAEKQVSLTLNGLAGLRGDAAVGPVARLRAGILFYELGKFNDSRREIAEALRGKLHQFDRYLAHLVLGLGFLAEQRKTDAHRAFEAAVAEDPDVVSGAMEFAALAFTLGERARGSAAVDRALAAKPRRDDPWQRPCPDCAGWSDRLAYLRSAVRK